MSQALQFLILTTASWLNHQQEDAIDHLRRRTGFSDSTRQQEDPLHRWPAEAARGARQEARVPALKDYIDDDVHRITSALEIDLAVFAGAAIRHWERTYVGCLTALATWLTGIGIAKSMDDMPKTIRKRVENGGDAGSKPADPPPRPWSWDPFAKQHSPLAPPRIFREFMIRYGHLTKPYYARMQCGCNVDG